jgi:hypothetical protein
MTWLKRTIIALVATTAVFFAVGLALPSEYGVERKLLVDAPAERAFDEVNNLENYNLWSPWKAADPTMKVTYGEKRVGEGASYSWTSEESGEGTLTITSSTPHERIETDLDFGEMGTAKGYWVFVEKGDSVEVTWGFAGDAGANIPTRYMGLMMDGMVGPQFEAGLAEIKKRAEAESPAGP